MSFTSQQYLHLSKYTKDLRKLSSCDIALLLIQFLQVQFLFHVCHLMNLQNNKNLDNRYRMKYNWKIAKLRSNWNLEPK